LSTGTPKENLEKKYRERLGKKVEDEAKTVGKTWSDPRRKMEEIYLALHCGGPVFLEV
jgi:hypothetical protein